MPRYFCFLLSTLHAFCLLHFCDCVWTLFSFYELGVLLNSIHGIGNWEIFKQKGLLICVPDRLSFLCCRTEGSRFICSCWLWRPVWCRKGRIRLNKSIIVGLSSQELFSGRLPNKSKNFSVFLSDNIWFMYVILQSICTLKKHRKLVLVSIVLWIYFSCSCLEIINEELFSQFHCNSL